MTDGLPVEIPGSVRVSPLRRVSSKDSGRRKVGCGFEEGFGTLVLGLIVWAGALLVILKVGKEDSKDIRSELVSEDLIRLRMSMTIRLR